MFGIETIGNLLSGNFSGAADSFSSGLDYLGNSPGLLTSILGAGSQLMQNSQTIDAQEELAKQKMESDKFNYLLELAKLKYAVPKGGGGKGGGGGSTRNKNADLIDVLSAGTDDRLKALGQLSGGIVGALK